MNLIILHGLYMHGIAMQPLAMNMEKIGYTTHLITYNSLAIEPERLFRRIDRALDESKTNVLIGHSLGGVMIQRYLDSRQPSMDVVSHVVTIGSPLQGASIVSVIEEMGMGALLGNSPEHGLTMNDNKWLHPQKLGSIAGDFDIGARRLLLGGMESSDGTVTVEETVIEGMTDHIVTHFSHTALIYNNVVTKQIDHFIQKDKFKHTS
ncbi:esterase/lipase family protein [Vibrio astriarenae]|uniref:esterase/lipase family protein n=1 Tax=Vibrio astriarenae TaxID=1481923 RepID=UPI0037355596